MDSQITSTLKTTRLPAEWEEQEFVQLTFPHADSDWKDTLEEVIPCFVNIATQIARFEKVLIVCQDEKQTRKLLEHIPSERLTLVEIPSDDTWARDHGAITIYEKTESKDKNKAVHLDFIFNGWGNKFEASKDNLITQKLQEKGVLTHPVKSVEMVLEGGSIESDGKGTILTTTQCLLSKERNPDLTKTDIEKKLEELFVATHILWLQNGHLEGDDTDAHIDTLARLCPDETICYVAPPQDASDSHFESLRKMEQEILSLQTKEGGRFHCVPLPFAKPVYDQEDRRRLPATYANFLIINKAVLVPTYRDEENDNLAISQIQKAFPDREIIGIDCLPIIRQNGSLHCLTMQFPKLG